MPEKLEFNLFKQYSQVVKDFIIETCYLSRYSKDSNVLVAYETPARAFARYIFPVINGQQIRPVISFHLANMQYLTAENHLGFVGEYIYDSTLVKVKDVKAPLIYSLLYPLTLRAVLLSDMDIMLYQLMVKAHKNKKAYKAVDGQWAEIMVGDPINETNLEPGDAQDKIIRFRVDLTIPRAYLPQRYGLIQPILGDSFTYQSTSPFGDSFVYVNIEE